MASLTTCVHFCRYHDFFKHSNIRFHTNIYETPVVIDHEATRRQAAADAAAGPASTSTARPRVQSNHCEHRGLPYCGSGRVSAVFVAHIDQLQTLRATRLLFYDPSRTAQAMMPSHRRRLGFFSSIGNVLGGWGIPYILLYHSASNDVYHAFVYG